MKELILLGLNLFLLVLFIKLIRAKNLLSYLSRGRWWLTWLSVGIITFMDEFTSMFYAPSETHRFIGNKAIFFLILTAVFIHYSTTRMVEIAEILEKNGIKGGGVYSFSYLVLGPLVSFIAVASIMVDYILTACISAVSAVANGLTFISLSPLTATFLPFAVIWFIAGLNIIGIRENARFTFSVFVVAIFVILNLITLGYFHSTPQNIEVIKGSFHNVYGDLTGDDIFHAIYAIAVGMGSSVLAYSGIESVLQTAGLVKGWRDIGKAYIFLALTVGIITPIVSVLVLSSPLDFKSHEGDLITHYAGVVGNPVFSLIVGFLASLALMMAVNTAFVASSELLERVAHRYGFKWLIKTNKQGALYRIHLLSAVFYSVILIITGGALRILAEMYAIGLLATFCINMGSLIIYRFFKGTQEIRDYYTSRIGTLIIWLVFLSCFIYLALHKPYGTGLWAISVIFFLIAGLQIARKRAPEIKEIGGTDFPMELITRIAECDEEEIHIYFRRPGERKKELRKDAFFITFFSPRQGIPPKIGDNYFRFPIFKTQGVYYSILAVLHTLRADLSEKRFVIHLGWPTASWIDRMSVGLFVFNLMKLPKLFPEFEFVIEHGSQ
ncbi:MAG: APC family permease [Candidatus Dadabacteria bacterium]|nr:APC family permease [Candidatus Dadabacteria bacterium]